MQAIFETVIPVFFLIALGFAAAKLKLIDEAGTTGLSRFVFLFAIPAFLFRTSMQADITSSAPWALWGAYYGSAAIVWITAIFISPGINSLSPYGGSIAAISSSFGNLVLLGIPLSIAHYGPDAALPAALIVAIHAPVQWFFATLRAEYSSSKSTSTTKMFGELIMNLAANPIVMALVLGAAWGFTGLGLHPVIDKSISFLGRAGGPAALFALGLSLASYGLKGNIRGLTMILLLKMLCFPIIAAIMAFWVFNLPPLTASVVVLFASMPPGANAFLFASRYKAAIAPVSGAIALGVLIALFSVSVILWMLGPV